MHVISRKPFSDAAKKYPNDAATIDALYKSLKNNNFSNPLEMKNVYPSLDNFKYKAKWYVLDIGGKSLVSMILNGSRKLTKEHIQAISSKYNISPALFFGCV
ncbi:type II toxin-antitoxin system HigB family toxin [Aliivibrio wodanis]|uniref:type II toxin-antitoxin system HigB family toxin n=1 Tax=Aliivibrio wodanis TaxID=80852 RepID=UPI00406BF19A